MSGKEKGFTLFFYSCQLQAVKVIITSMYVIKYLKIIIILSCRKGTNYFRQMHFFWQNSLVILGVKQLVNVQGVCERFVVD